MPEVPLSLGCVPLHLARGEPVVGAIQSEREQVEHAALHAAWRADARGKAIARWLARLNAADARAALPA